MNLRSNTAFWEYLSDEQRDLLIEGVYLSEEVIKSCKYCFKDYSFVVFPFAKAYEGFLKKLFRDVGYISPKEYSSDFMRLGKLLSPNLVRRLGNRSLYKQVRDNVSQDLADELWTAWKYGRNQVFHYFPHNFKSLTFEQAKILTAMIQEAMVHSYDRLQSEIYVK